MKDELAWSVWWHLAFFEDLYFDSEEEVSALAAVCTTFRGWSNTLAWRKLGQRKFRGIQILDPALGEATAFDAPTAVQDWKKRYWQFQKTVFQFRAPDLHIEPRDESSFDFENDLSVITGVNNKDEVAYTTAILEKEVLTSASIYVEVNVRRNADNLSLALVDFDEGGKSSITFSPDTGAVIKETKIQEFPRKVQGSYIQPLSRIGGPFEGKIGLYIDNGKLAFYRKYEGDRMGKGSRDWECSGFVVTNDCWADGGNRLTPCLAFRQPGNYNAAISAFGTPTPPCAPGDNHPYFSGTQKWIVLDWEQPSEPDEADEEEDHAGEEQAEEQPPIRRNEAEQDDEGEEQEDQTMLSTNESSAGSAEEDLQWEEEEQEEEEQDEEDAELDSLSSSFDQHMSISEPRGAAINCDGSGSFRNLSTAEPASDSDDSMRSSEWSSA